MLLKHLQHMQYVQHLSIYFCNIHERIKMPKRGGELGFSKN
jgi:hypothetical protein